MATRHIYDRGAALAMHPTTRKEGTSMLKLHLLKLLVGLAIIASLIAGVALGSGAATARVAPAQHVVDYCGGGVGTHC